MRADLNRDSLDKDSGTSVVSWIWLALSLAILLLSPLSCSSQSGARTTGQFINSDGTKSPELDLELVWQPTTRARGLMYRKAMEPNAGMLFLFPDELERSFWMKNTYIELDIIFVNSNLEIVSVAEKAVPHTETPRRSSGPARYVVEVSGGKFKEWGLKPGSKLKLSSELPIAE